MDAWEKLREAESSVFTTPLPGAEVLKMYPLDAAILDIACGYGRVLRHLADLGYTNLTGNDISLELITRAKRLIPEAKLFTGDMCQFSAATDIDLVLLMGSIEYILTDEGQAAFLKHICGLLKPGGRIYLDTFTLDPEVFATQYEAGLQRTGHWGLFVNSRGFNCHHSSYERMRALLSDGFEIELESQHKITTWSGRKVNGYSALARRV